MADEKRLRYPGLKTTLSGSHSNSTTTFTFAAALTDATGTAIPTLAADEYLPLSVLDSSGVLKEVVYLTAYTSAATSGTVVRGREGFSGQTFTGGETVSNNPTTYDVQLSVDLPWGGDLGYDVEFQGNGTSLPSGWSWTNQGSATYTETYGAGIITAPGVSSESLRIIRRAVPSESSWKAHAKLTQLCKDSNYCSTGILLRQSADSKLVRFGIRQDGFAIVESWTNETTFSAAVVSNFGWYPTNGSWRYYLRLTKNSATSYDFDVSLDGRAWLNIMSANNITSFLSGTIDQIGFYNSNSNNNPSHLSIDWFRVR